MLMCVYLCWLCVCMYVDDVCVCMLLYVCVYVDVRVRKLMMCVYVCWCKNVCSCICDWWMLTYIMCVYVRWCVCMYVFVCVRMLMCVYVCGCKCICSCTCDWWMLTYVCSCVYVVVWCVECWCVSGEASMDVHVYVIDEC